MLLNSKYITRNFGCSCAVLFTVALLQLENFRWQQPNASRLSVFGPLNYVLFFIMKSSGFSRGASIDRRITRCHQHGRWLARIGKVAGNKDLYLGHSRNVQKIDDIL
ncbi:hypothetical protein DVH24_032897 [Malus domestica]|uniref:Uncharacterized protein n=1 Tax=Malus domestica TaxID=3750 RepID=A0A498ITF7_MALDO|nr:hypothetical protein DVH24_032897 [Malus domestica]